MTPLIARHLVTHHNIRHLILTSRQGPHAPGAHQLRTELEQLGAHTTITANDAADPPAGPPLRRTGGGRGGGAGGAAGGVAVVTPRSPPA